MSGVESRYERLELKYLIDERTAAAVRRDIELYCEPDPHNSSHDSSHDASHGPLASDVPGYVISSLYLDSPGLAFHQAKERGDPERLKLRVRSYEGSRHGVLEIKRRISDVIDKTRAAVDRDDVRAAVEGRAAAVELDAGPFVEHFARISAESGAQPSLHVRYVREAYDSAVDDYARVTFDRNIEARRADDWSLEPSDGWTRFDDHWSPTHQQLNVVLELKCHSFVPWWITDLVRRRALKRCSFSKYSVGIHVTARELGFESLARRSAKVMR